ncbi:hypothetical protein KL930_002207 [Ogataea haglerorum]|uniref:Secreted protein n=1 Tax=Ogataea haglerorum TaxID=1937702 RepID=A0AAN6I1X0_9ASCO|nr:uncharacterized protein KL911_000189 [Ogataea haglerorum]KAG7699006.1 hypothetical protein KL915_001298 [Ogataea haglerorum]KAG7700609.1 hypothetical protein KL951_000724 [Ogataea haglerorum]KAG7710048.1 hypothetical protein KL914_000958 [Ogataea haglerorum]KAG7711171.1 hypothetical protein KL950_001137 [Ogataea haglerorum]KAG7720469.1 hypothetical protein KL913_001369 [Ogataea haglerorum]
MAVYLVLVLIVVLRVKHPVAYIAEEVLGVEFAPHSSDVGASDGLVAGGADKIDALEVVVFTKRHLDGVAIDLHVGGKELAGTGVAAVVAAKTVDMVDSVHGAHEGADDRFAALVAQLRGFPGHHAVCGAVFARTIGRSSKNALGISDVHIIQSWDQAGVRNLRTVGCSVAIGWMRHLHALKEGQGTNECGTGFETLGRRG